MSIKKSRNYDVSIFHLIKEDQENYFKGYERPKLSQVGTILVKACLQQLFQSFSRKNLETKSDKITIYNFHNLFLRTF